MKNKTHQNRILQGLCPFCGEQPPLKNRRKCISCTIKMKQYNEAKQHKRNANCELCITCGGNRDDERKTCSTCRIRIKQWRLDNLAKGHCKCGKQPINDSNHCKSCYLKSVSFQNLGSISQWQELDNLFQSQNGICPYSGIQLILGVNSSLDHKIAKSCGGSNDIDNLQWTHKLVNQMKWDTEESQFLSMVLIIADNVRKSSNQFGEGV